jgi:predicted dehydrogenase
MQNINWGIIGCGDVTEIKSGPAFNKVPNSALVAVMRRDAVKAEDYARRHQVPRWYTDAEHLINDPEVNAVYIATPPSSHEQYAIAAINAGKHVYLEKPMAHDLASAKRIADAAAANNIKLVTAHYRREWPLFKKLKELLQQDIIGHVRTINLQLNKSVFTKEQLLEPTIAWRVDPAISGGGIFHDLAPHQLDIMYHLFGAAKKIQGISLNQAGAYAADDTVAGTILFENNIVFIGTWCFCADAHRDICEITGDKGRISFSFFTGNSLQVTVNNTSSNFEFDMLQHVQQPLIARMVQYFLGKDDNPCPGYEAVETMHWIEEITQRQP